MSKYFGKSQICQLLIMLYSYHKKRITLTAFKSFRLILFKVIILNQTCHLLPNSVLKGCSKYGIKKYEYPTSAFGRDFVLFRTEILKILVHSKPNTFYRFNLSLNVSA